MFKAKPCSDPFEVIELCRSVVTFNRQMLGGRTQVLSHGEHIDIVPAQVFERLDELVVRFS